VGNRCKKCAGRFTSHVLKASPQILLRLGLAMLLLGVAYGYVAPLTLYMPLGIYGYVIEFFLFFTLGKVMYRVAGYKQGAKVITAATGGLLLGLALGPFRDQFIVAVAASGTENPTDPSASSELNYYLVNLAIMAVGLLSSFMRKQ